MSGAFNTEKDVLCGAATGMKISFERTHEVWVLWNLNFVPFRRQSRFVT